jgi:hypothetical protein
MGNSIAAICGIDHGAGAAESIIDSIERIEITLGNGVSSNTGTIVSVDTSRTVLFNAGFTGASAAFDRARVGLRRTLTDSTTVTIDRSDTVDVAVQAIWVVQFKPGVIDSIQSGTITDTASLVNDTITAVDLSRSIVIPYGQSMTTNVDESFYVHLTSTTNVRAEKASTNSFSINYTVVEFASAYVNEVLQIQGTFFINQATPFGTTFGSPISLVVPGGQAEGISNQATVAIGNSYFSQIGDTQADGSLSILSLSAGVSNSFIFTIAMDSFSTTTEDITLTVPLNDTTKTIVSWIGANVSNDVNDRAYCHAQIINDTTIRLTRPTAGTTSADNSFLVVEFD